MNYAREALTKKAFAAISKYATIKAGDVPIHHNMVKYVLEAERMDRQKLYKWLEGKGYRWVREAGFWEKKDRKGESPIAYSSGEVSEK